MRVLFSNVSELLTEIMMLICSHEPDLEDIAPKGKLNLLEAVEAAMPDVIIIGEEDSSWKEACQPSTASLSSCTGDQSEK